MISPLIFFDERVLCSYYMNFRLYKYVFSSRNIMVLEQSIITVVQDAVVDGASAVDAAIH